MEILIVGAGTTGLLLAQGLKQANLPFRIYERDSETQYYARPRDWGMTLHWGHSVLRSLLPPQLRDRMHEAIGNPYHMPKTDTLVHYDGETGEPLMKTPVEDVVRVSRKRLRSLLSEGLDVKFAKVLVGIEKIGERVVAEFDDGEKVEVDVIVGCDGAHSQVRRCLVGEEAAKTKRLDVNMYNFVAGYDAQLNQRLWDVHPVFFNCLNRRGTFFWMAVQEVPDREKPETWKFQNLFVWKGAPYPEELDTVEKRRAHFRSQAEFFAEPWKSVFLQVPVEEPLKADSVHTWKPIDWSKSTLAGHVTLAGDAAHSLSMHRGQGLNLAFLDCAKLVEGLSKAEQTSSGWRTAVLAYEEEMHPRGGRNVELSEMDAEVLHNYEKILQSPLAKMGLRKSTADDVPADSAVGASTDKTAAVGA